MKKAIFITTLLVSPLLQAFVGPKPPAKLMTFVCTQPPKEGGKPLAVVSFFEDGFTKIDLGHLKAHGEYKAKHGDCPSRLCGYLTIDAKYSGPAEIDLHILQQGIIQNGYMTVKYAGGKSTSQQAHTMVCVQDFPGGKSN